METQLTGFTPATYRPHLDDATREEVARVYFSISEVSDMLGMSQSRVRGICKEFKIEPARNSGNNRRFTQKEIHRIKCVSVLMGTIGMTLLGAKQWLRINGFPGNYYLNQIIASRTL